MAVAIPAMAAIGGGSALTGGILLAAAGASVWGGVTAAREQRRAGRFAEAQANIDAAAEGDAARQREIQRKEMLRRALSSQIAASGAAGVAFEGSLARIAELDIEQANRDATIDNANSKQRQRSLRAQGRAARFTGKQQARMTLLDTAARTATSFIQ